MASIKKEYESLRNEFFCALPDDVNISFTLRTRIENNHYALSTLKKMCAILIWFEKHRKELPEGIIQFHGNKFSIKNRDKLIYELWFSGTKPSEQMIISETGEISFIDYSKQK